MSERRAADKLERIVKRYGMVFVVIFIALVVGGIAYVSIEGIAKKNNLKHLVNIEDTDESYESILSSYAFGDEIPSDDENVDGDITLKTLENLVEKYNAIAEEAGKMFAAQEAHYRSGILSIYLKEFENAKSSFESALSIQRKSYLQPKILASLAAISEELGEVQESKNYYLRISDNYKTSIEFPHAQISLGRIAEAQDKENGTKTAQSYYLDLSENELWQDSDWANFAKSRLANLGYTGYAEPEDTSSAH